MNDGIYSYLESFTEEINLHAVLNNKLLLGTVGSGKSRLMQKLLNVCDLTETDVFLCCRRGEFTALPAEITVFEYTNEDLNEQTVAHHFDSFYARRQYQQTLCVIPDAADFPPNRRQFLQKLLTSGESYLWLSFNSHLSIELTWNLWMLPFFHDIYYFRLEKAARPFFYAEEQSFFDELIEFPDDVYRRLGSVY